MIIDELVLHNFGIFGGRQEVRLDPPSSDRPVVLFGGLNGAGKTTLLEAMQLALFGKLAPPARDSEGGYEAYLERSINRRARPKDGASVEIAFRSTGDGQEHTYRIRRSWAVKRRNIAEQLDVEVDGLADPALADTWSDQVHRFLPPQLAPLFLFDGERIEALADPENSEGFLSVAIDALLGMDLVRQLETDLTVLERRKRAEAMSDKARKRLDEESEQLNGLDEEIKRKKIDAGALRNRLDGLAHDRKGVEREFRAQGGDLLQRREALETERSELLTSAGEHRRALVEHATGPLPLSLVGQQLHGMLERADQEAEVRRIQESRETLKTHRAGLEEKLARTAAGDEAVRALAEYFAELEAESIAGGSDAARLNIGDGTREMIRRLVESGLEGERERARESTADLTRIMERLDEVERQLAIVPEADAIRDVTTRRDALIAQQTEAQEALDNLEVEIEELEGKRSRQLERLDQVLKDAASEGLEEERRERLLEHSSWARDTLSQFRQAALQRNLERIQELVLECYQALLRKHSLVSAIRIDPNRYRMRLYNSSDEGIAPARLSAGERQLLAVATLWGLARASGRPLPVVVDTPLGRLDGSHRQHLVTRYFPEASHQVLLLSTDEEIVANYLTQLAPAIGRAYRLEYDDETGSTVIHEGYFEEVAAA